MHKIYKKSSEICSICSDQGTVPWFCSDVECRSSSNKKRSRRPRKFLLSSKKSYITAGVRHQFQERICAVIEEQNLLCLVAGKSFYLWVSCNHWVLPPVGYRLYFHFSPIFVPHCPPAIMTEHSQFDTSYVVLDFKKKEWINK